MAKSQAASKSKKNPLSWHKATGRWCINLTDIHGRRRTFYFAADLEESLQQYNGGGDCWRQGVDFRKESQSASVCTLADMVNLFLKRCSGRVEQKEMSPRTFEDYVWIGRQLLASLGRNVNPEKLRPADFEKFRASMMRYSPRRSSKAIVGVKTFFRWAHGEEIIEHIPRFGNDFRPPAKSAERAHKTLRGAKLYSADDIRALFSHADEQLTGMILLGINAGLGNADLARLPLSAVDLDRGILDFPRPKTGIGRRVPLWPETISAIKTVIANRRPKPEHAELIFLTGRGSPYVEFSPRGNWIDKINPLFRRLAKRAGVHREGLGIYTLRHVLQTVGDETKDFLAVSSIMGHSDNSVSGLYREGISDDRLRAVTDHLREWLFGESQPETESTATDKPVLRVVG